MGRLTGQGACVPVHSASFSHVAKLAERHFAPPDMKLQPEKIKKTVNFAVFFFNLVFTKKRKKGFSC
jgi:hypothetical protein